MQISDFARFVLADVPGCPDEMVRLAVVRAARRLCNESKIWSEVQYPMDLQDANNTYEPSVPTGARLVGVMRAWCGPRKLVRKTMAEISDALPNWQTARSSEPVYFNGSVDWNTIKVFPIPTDPKTQLTLEVWYEPKTEATALPDFILQRYEAQIIRGATAILLAMSRQLWTDLQASLRLQAEFDNDVAIATISMIHDRAQGSLRVRSLPFA